MIHLIGNKHSGYGPDNRRLYFKGGGGGGQVKYDNLERLYQEQADSARLLRAQARAHALERAPALIERGGLARAALKVQTLQQPLVRLALVLARILERGGKVDRTVKYVVDDDEDDEYEQYHGFNMRM